MAIATLEDHLDAMVALARTVPGHLSDRDVRFLALAAATLPPALGEILEIGSFMGRSTVVLARSVALAGGDRVQAVDPLDLPSSTDPRGPDPEQLAASLQRTLEAHGVADTVIFHRQRAEVFAGTWRGGLRMLWIDGDHTYDGVRADFEGFHEWLSPGGIVAFHDVLNPFEGPLRVFTEQVLASPGYGESGLCGSIGWARYIGPDAPAGVVRSANALLAERLQRLRRLIGPDRRFRKLRRRAFRLARGRLPNAVPEAGVFRDVSR